MDPFLLVLPLPRSRLHRAGGAWWCRVHIAASEGVEDENSSDDEMHRVRNFDDRVSSDAEARLGMVRRGRVIPLAGTTTTPSLTPVRSCGTHSTPTRSATKHPTAPERLTHEHGSGDGEPLGKRLDALRHPPVPIHDVGKPNSGTFAFSFWTMRGHSHVVGSPLKS
jgi:hypothetical protein